MPGPLREGEQDEGRKEQTPKEFSPEIIAIMAVYFVQGALGLSRLALSFYMKDELHLSPTDMAALGGITSLPWVLKPLYGFLSDGLPIFGYRRRSYLVLAGILGCLSWLSLGFQVATTTSTVVLATAIGSASVAVSDVVVDSIVVERSRGGGKEGDGADTGFSGGDLQSLCWGSAAIGGILSAYFSGSLLSTVTPQTVFTITAGFPLLISAASFFINEKPIGDEDKRDDSIKNQLKQLFFTLKNPSIFLPVLFIFGWQATPTADSAMFFFSTGELGFTPEFLGRVRLASSLASLIGVFAYRTWLKDKPIKDVIFGATVLSVPLGLTQVLLTSHLNRAIGIPDTWFALSDTVVLSVLGQVAFMPTLVLASSLCPPGVEGALFATLMSIYNLSGTVASELGALLTSALGVSEGHYDNLSLLVAICTLSGLLPLPFIGLLDIAKAQHEDADSKSKSL